MDIKACTPSLSAWIIIFGIIGYYTLDWYEQTYQARLVVLKKQITQSSRLTVDSSQPQVLNQEEIEVLLKSTQQFFQVLQVLLTQDSKIISFKAMKYTNQSITLNGMVNSIYKLTPFMEKLSDIMHKPLDVRSFMNASGNVLHFELTTESNQGVP